MNDFTWIEDYRQTFEELKNFLESLLLLSKIEIRETLYLYFAAIPEAVSFMLIQLDDKGA